MISDKVLQALNEQLNAEYYSSYLYLAMAACFESETLPGFAHWMRVQSQEEMGHALKFFDHIVDRNGKVALQPVEAPPAAWDSPLAAFEAAYEHEQKITARINDLVNLAISEGDHATHIFLQWFVSEQVEEEKSADEVVQILKKVGDSVGGLYQLDHRLGHRS
jgi:ferritin